MTVRDHTMAKAKSPRMSSAPRSAEVPVDLEQQLCFAVYSTMLAFNKVYRVLLGSLDLTYPQYLVMLALWQGDGVTVSDIGDRLSLDSSTLTPLLKRLEAAGLVARQRAEGDERRVVVTLTPAGRRLRSSAKDIPGRLAQMIGAPVEEIVALRCQLEAVRGALLRGVA